MKIRKGVVAACATLILGVTGTCFASTSTYEGNSFLDVKDDAWYHGAVEFNCANNLIKGYNETTFAPDDKLTRGMLVTILFRMDGAKENDGKSKFEDVDSKEWYAQPIKWAVENGIIHGYEGTKNFGPNDNILRQDLAGILRNYSIYKKINSNVSEELTKFSDYKDVSDYAKTSMKWAVGAGVITGNANGTLNPLGNATRAEASAMIQKYCTKVENYSSLVGYYAPQLNTTLYNIEDVALKKLNLVNSQEIEQVFNFDINKDGKEEIFNVTRDGQNYGNTRIVCKTKDGEIIYDSKNDKNSIIPAGYISDLYIYDFDKNDNNLDLIINGDIASDDFTYSIVSFNGNNVTSRKNSIQDGLKLFVNDEGIALGQYHAFNGTTPVISNNYYNYKEDKLVDLDFNCLKNKTITFRNVIFTDSLDNIEKIMSNNPEEDYKKAIENAGLYEYEAIRGTIIDNGNNIQLKVKLEDGREGYIFVANGTIAG